MSTNPFKRIEYDYGATAKQHESRAIYAETELNCYSDGDYGVLEIDGAQRYFPSFEQAKKIYKQMIAISHEMTDKKEKEEERQQREKEKLAKAKAKNS